MWLFQEVIVIPLLTLSCTLGHLNLPQFICHPVPRFSSPTVYYCARYSWFLAYGTWSIPIWGVLLIKLLLIFLQACYILAFYFTWAISNGEDSEVTRCMFNAQVAAKDVQSGCAICSPTTVPRVALLSVIGNIWYSPSSISAFFVGMRTPEITDSLVCKYILALS